VDTFGGTTIESEVRVVQNNNFIYPTVQFWPFTDTQTHWKSSSQSLPSYIHVFGSLIH